MKGQVIDTTQGPNEKRALAYMDGFMSFSFISDEEKEKIKAAKQAVKQAKFQKLQREVNALKRNAKKNKIKATDLLDALIKILDKYPIDVNENGDSTDVVSLCRLCFVHSTQQRGVL